MHEPNRPFLSLGGIYMSLGVYIQRGIGPGGKCPGGTWPGVYVLGLHAWAVHVRRGEGGGSVLSPCITSPIGCKSDKMTS